METILPGPPISEEDVRDLVEMFAGENCCYGSRPAKEMQIRNVIMSNAYHYTLETYTEKRETQWRETPYYGEQPRNETNGAVSPWSVYVLPTEMFKDSSRKLEIPGSDSIQSCSSCGALGETTCYMCSGTGRKPCTFCRGSGRDSLQGNSCTPCGGSGNERCFTCGGDGMKTCNNCSGSGKVKKFVQLTVTWTNHLEGTVSTTTELPIKKILKAKGYRIFRDHGKTVAPIQEFYEAAINEASDYLLAKHRQQFPKERIMQQRHLVYMIPVAKIQYSWKNRNGDFLIYGIERKVYFPNYPEMCCWGCVIS